MSTAMVKTSLRTGLSGRAKWQSRPLEAGMVRSSVMISVSKPLCITETLTKYCHGERGSIQEADFREKVASYWWEPTMWDILKFWKMRKKDRK